MLTNPLKNPQNLPKHPTYPSFLLLLFSIFTSTNPISASTTPLISRNSTIQSPNRTFEIGYFSPDSGSTNWYVGIWYSAIPIRTYVWVANRNRPIKNQTSSVVQITEDGRLAITDGGNSSIWATDNDRPAISAMLLESGNFVLLDKHAKIVWQSFDSPADTWLPGMHVIANTAITCWRSVSDPSPGPYTLRLNPPVYGEFELVYQYRQQYWSTGSWRGSSFSGVPEMTVPYIYNFRFDKPFTPQASFVYTEMPGAASLLTRFVVDYSGQLKQYTWSSQTNNWNMFWSRPESACRVYGLCGELGFCRGGSGRILSPCRCFDGYLPNDLSGWRAGDYMGGCRRTDNNSCSVDDGFVSVGPIGYQGNATSVLVPSGGGQSSCEESCLKNCSCFGLNYNAKTGECKNLYGNPMNFQNLTVEKTGGAVFYIRVGKEALINGKKKNSKWKLAALIGGLVGLVLLLGLVILAIAIWKKKQKLKLRSDEDGSYSVMSLKVFSYKELSLATRGFSEKLGHGGFGAVFRGALPDSTPIAVKRLERPGGGDREFRAEVCTIGNIQHVNLVRLRGFCSENSHRLLVYDYMENGPLSVFLRRDGRFLSWEVRFRIAVGTARGIAYLHEECRDCIIHCDIKPENILLDGEFGAKVSDFGLAKLVGRDFSRVMTTMRGTWGYVAPEWISGVAITAKADVYSYGMTLLEIIGGRRNVESPPQASGPARDEKWFFPPWAARQIIEGNVDGVVDARLGEAFDRAEAERAALIAVWCIQDDEAARPTMGTVVKMLEGTVDVAVPPAPQLLQALFDGDSFPEGGIGSGQEISTPIGVRSDDMGSDVGSTGSAGNRNLTQSR
ncbi:G-type lectin S-receptor-like serine/threonine-protein kinase SD2-2 [Magnolia sinica]|uniref:G-type lectin S-receptor-like serine/threonine-protein kinase SD2-2 n=1 Tax=Magnolia sinica TaxID=86752 RepID=UPI0026591478|nr:G-type lectin S-receptor-like serine/threonine-protein kinase SD2-2 [Magnolia sinica]